MKKPTVLQGKIVSGVRKAAVFTRLDWVQAQCLEKLAFRPYPGTLNVELDGESLRAFDRLDTAAAVRLSPPDPIFCEARAMAVTVEGTPGAIIIPAEAVRVHGKQIIEVLAPVRLRDALQRDDGDLVELIF